MRRIASAAAVSTARRTPADQRDVGLVDEGSRLERQARRLARELLGGGAEELVVDWGAAAARRPRRSGRENACARMGFLAVARLMYWSVPAGGLFG